MSYFVKDTMVWLSLSLSFSLFFSLFPILSASVSLFLFLSQFVVYSMEISNSARQFPYRKSKVKSNKKSSNKSKVKLCMMWHTVLGQSCYFMNSHIHVLHIHVLVVMLCVRLMNCIDSMEQYLFQLLGDDTDFGHLKTFNKLEMFLKLCSGKSFKHYIG